MSTERVVHWKLSEEQKGNARYFKTLKISNDRRYTVDMSYRMVMAQMKNDGVAFGDISNRILNEAKKLGLYKKEKNLQTGEMDYPPLSKLHNQRIGWAVDADLFLGWVKRNWKGYDKEKIHKVNTNPPKPKVKTSIYIQGQEYKITVIGVDEGIWQNYLEEHGGEDDNTEMDITRIESSIKRDYTNFITAIQNVMDEDEEVRISFLEAFLETAIDNEAEAVSTAIVQ